MKRNAYTTKNLLYVRAKKSFILSQWNRRIHTFLFPTLMLWKIIACNSVHLCNSNIIPAHRMHATSAFSMGANFRMIVFPPSSIKSMDSSRSTNRYNKLVSQ